MLLFIFTRDFRIVDNTALINCFHHAKKLKTKIIPAFILNDDQLSDKNKYKSENAINFMFESLVDLNKYLNNSLIYCKDVKDILKEYHITDIYMNRDITPYSSRKIQYFQSLHPNIHTFEDYTLDSLNSTLTDKGTVYKVFTPFYKKFIKKYKNKVDKTLIDPSIFFNTLSKQTPPKTSKHFLKGGRNEALKIKLNKNYEKERDFMHLEGTTMLSAYLKFGCVSIREVFKKAKGIPALQRQFIWREFYYNLYNEKQYIQFINKENINFNTKLSFKWENNMKLFDLWKQGNTGFPIVDAAMRQLLSTGYMHNRSRMIVASFLVKDLHVDWRLGEQYFATKLTDYDPIQNNAGWQWSAGTGADPQPYFRIFNPMLQQKKFDKDNLYIDKWNKNNKSKPCVDHRERAKKFLKDIVIKQP